MASSSSGEMAEEFVEGTMVWVNQNYHRHADWQERIKPDQDYKTDSCIHTFTIHGTSRTGGVESQKWFSFQSNVYAYIIAPVKIPKKAAQSYPKEADGLMETIFLPNVFITAADFPATTDAVPELLFLDCTHEKKQDLWIEVRKSLERLKLRTGAQGEKKHLTHTISTVTAKLRTECGYVDDVVMGDTLGQPSGTLDRPRRLNIQLKLPQEALEEYDREAPWESVHQFMTDFDNSKLVADCDLSVFSTAQASAGLLLKIASEELKTGLSTAIRNSSIKGVIAAKTPRQREGPPPAKASRRTAESTTLYLNIDYERQHNFFRSECLVHWVVWIIERGVLEALLASRDPTIVSQGHYRHVVNQSSDKRRVRVCPPLPGTSVNDGNKAISNWIM